MINDNFSKKLEEMEKPRASLPEQERRLRLTFINAKKAAWWGALLILFPAGALFFVLLSLALKQDVVIEFIKAMDTPLVLAIMPLAALILNLLAVLHIHGENSTNELVLTISLKKRLWNIAIIVLILAMLGFLAIYGILENWQCIIGLQKSC